ncbi:DUF2017 domain-containing protein [Nocardioides seonyuensis]|uniref:DUF2017 domain-containing protein n=1 Tax=Nocardioides seonyuensis TaxID=2518371 RepID=A0A4P7IBH4_9ACTN|nr:DUF2017 domain-containing protein [Nocardioides seonyuensis]QBX54379.1 DUF2017 domain-containing protein [Nocardioides seonyuensis]
MNGFERHQRSGRVIAAFSGFEADLLRSLASQMVELLRNERAVPSSAQDPFEAMMSDFSGPSTIPEDPVLARLFPTAYLDDDESAADFRRFTESTLRDGKAAAASDIIETLEEAGLPAELTEDGLMIDVELEEPQAMTWMRAFTDIRLALATRLGVEAGDEEFWEALPDEDPRAQAHDIYDWVGWLQESLVEALSA